MITGWAQTSIVLFPHILKTQWYMYSNEEYGCLNISQPFLAAASFYSLIFWVQDSTILDVAANDELCSGFRDIKFVMKFILSRNYKPNFATFLPVWYIIYDIISNKDCFGGFKTSTYPKARLFMGLTSQCSFVAIVILW